MNFKDYYKILGVSPKASIQEIKSAYRKLSKKFHPDVNEGDSFFEERFKEIQEAYETLSDEIRKKSYDFHYSSQGSNQSRNTYNEENIKKREEELKKQQEAFKKWEEALRQKEEKLRHKKKFKINIKPIQSFTQKIIKRKKDLIYVIIGCITFVAIIFISKINQENNQKRQEAIASFKSTASHVLNGLFKGEDQNGSFVMFRCNFNQAEYEFPLMMMGCSGIRWTVDEFTPNSIILKSFCYTTGYRKSDEYIEITVLSNDELEFKTRNSPIRHGKLKRSKWDFLKGL